MPPPPKVPPRRERWGWVRTETASTWHHVISYQVITVYSILPLFTLQYAGSTFFPCIFPCNLTLFLFLSKLFSLLFYRVQAAFFPVFSSVSFSCGHKRHQQQSMSIHAQCLFIPLSRSIEQRRYSVPDSSTLGKSSFFVETNL